MNDDGPFVFVRVARWLDAEDVTFVLIGRQAVRLYGAPVQTSDYDLWVDPARRRDVLTWFDRGGRLHQA